MIPNFLRFADGLYRGGQPDQQGWIALRDLGVKEVIRLDTACEASPDDLSFEDYFYPISWVGQLLGPNKGVVRDAVDTIGPRSTYVHCLHGQDRTGLIVACYRVWKQQWSKPQAEKEMLANGFHKSLIGLWWFWKNRV